MTGPSRGRRALRLARDAAVVLLVTFVLAEVAFRAYNALDPTFIFPSNSYDRFRAAPHVPYYGHRFNASGFHDREHPHDPPEGTRRILVIGDSQVVGSVPYPSNFATLLEDDLDAAEVLNMGISGTSPEHYTALLANEGVQLQPNLVIVCVYVGNDFIDDAPPDLVERSYLLSFLQYVFEIRPSYEGTGGIDAEYDEDAEDMPWARFAALQRDKLGLFEAGSSSLPRRVAAAVENLGEARDVATGAGAELLVVSIPDELQVSPEVRQRVLEDVEHDSTTFDWDRPSRLLRDELDDAGIDVLDLLGPLREAHGSEGRQYKPNDTHLNSAGNRLAADRIAAAIAN